MVSLCIFDAESEYLRDLASTVPFFALTPFCVLFPIWETISHQAMDCKQEKCNGLLGVYYGVAVRRIWPYFGCGIRLLVENQCGIRFLCCYAVAEDWNLNKRFAVFHLLHRTFY